MIIAEIGSEKFELESMQQAETLLQILGQAKPVDTSFLRFKGKLVEIIHERENRYRAVDMSLSPSRGIISLEELQRLRDSADRDPAEENKPRLLKPEEVTE